MFRTIQRLIALPYVALVLITMLGTGILLSVGLRKDYLAETHKSLAAQTQLLGDLLIDPFTRGVDPDELDRLAKKWASLLNARVTIIGLDGVVLGESHQDRTGMDNHLDRPEVQQAISGGQGTATRYSATQNYENIYTASSILVENTVKGVVRLSLPVSVVQTRITGLEKTLIAVTFFAATISILLAIQIARGTTRPIRQLTQAVSQIAKSSSKHEKKFAHITPADPDEIAQLANAFNLMAVRLDAQISDLEAERNKNAVVLQEMTDGAIIVDGHGHIQLLNESAERMFGISQEKAQGHSIAEALRQHQVVELWKQCRESSKPQNSILEIATNKLYLQAVATPLEQYHPGSILMLFQNLTRQRFLETVRRDFVSNISHELRTPLASLKALTETLQSGALEDPPAAHRFLERMETEVDALTQMVAELLELSRIESGKVPLQLRGIHPKDVVVPAVERLRLQAERAILSLQITCPDDLPSIMADPSRLEQVIVNLLHNSIKFTHPGGQIDIQVNLGTGEESVSPEMVFSVSDTGVGIPANDLSRIFERFFKTDRARSGGGTGLGLAIARHMVEAHQGRIWAESVEGQGTTVYFSIPLAR
jgi:two-component system phosphate regulon sensor histidine kinase PhoR